MTMVNHPSSRLKENKQKKTAKECKKKRFGGDWSLLVVGDGQGDTLGSFTDTNNNKLTGKAASSNDGEEYFELDNVFWKLDLLGNAVPSEEGEIAYFRL